MSKKSIKVSRSPNKNWKNDALQFARLIAELEMAGAFTPEINALLRESMDLEQIWIDDLVNRAVVNWNKIKAQV